MSLLFIHVFTIIVEPVSTYPYFYLEWNSWSRRARSSCCCCCCCCCCSSCCYVLHFTLRVIWWKSLLNDFCTYRKNNNFCFFELPGTPDISGVPGLQSYIFGAIFWLSEPLLAKMVKIVFDLHGKKKLLVFMKWPRFPGISRTSGTFFEFRGLF